MADTNVAIKLYKTSSTAKRVGINVTSSTNTTGYALYVNGATNITGSLTLGTALPITSGGTGKTTAADAWTALGGGASGKHADSYFALASHTHSYAGSSSAGGAATLAIRLDHITLNSTTINNTAGSFAFSGSGDPWSGTDWVGLQIGDNVDKFQISANGNTIVFRENDNGGTNTSWLDWVTMLTSANYTSYAAPASHTHKYAGSSSAGGAATSALTATTAKYPLGFSARNTDATWGNQTGATVTSWNETDGGSIDFRKNNPSSGKLSVKVDGRFYFNEGSTPAAGLKSANGYWGMTDADGGDSDWIRTTTVGIIPYQSGGAGSGHCGLGTSSWYFSYAYIDSIYTTSGAAGFKCRNISYGSGDPSGGSSGDIYIKFV